MIFSDILTVKDGMIKGPFGGDVKKSLFVEKANDTYKVYEQSVVAENDYTVGDYYLPKKYVEKKLHRFLIKPGDILLTGAGTLGLLSIVPDGIEEGIINQALIRIRLNESVIYKPYFVYYFPWYIKRVAMRLNGDSVIPNLPPLSVLKKIEIDMPPIAEQQKIADFLSKIDEVIQKNENTIRLSKRLMREIYDYWFVQFDFPDENGRPYKASGGEMVYDEKLKREIPKGWKTIELGDIIKEAKKSSVQVNGARERVGTYPFFTSGDEILDFDEYYVDGFNIFLNTGGNADIKSYYGKSAYSTDTWCISADKYSYMLFIFLDSIKEQINNNCFAGSGLKHLQKNAFKKIKMVAPEDNLLSTFNDLALSSYQAISFYRTENKKLTSLRDWLLPMLMNGQIKISD